MASFSRRVRGGRRRGGGFFVGARALPARGLGLHQRQGVDGEAVGPGVDAARRAQERRAHGLDEILVHVELHRQPRDREGQAVDVVVGALQLQVAAQQLGDGAVRALDVALDFLGPLAGRLQHLAHVQLDALPHDLALFERLDHRGEADAQGRFEREVGVLKIATRSSESPPIGSVKQAPYRPFLSRSSS
jgi:hypothetical protein